MYQRDFLILVLAAFLVYFTLQNEGPFSFRRAWYDCCPITNDWTATNGLSRYYPLTAEDSSIFSSNEILPKPVVVRVLLSEEQSESDVTGGFEWRWITRDGSRHT